MTIVEKKFDGDDCLGIYNRCSSCMFPSLVCIFLKTLFSKSSIPKHLLLHKEVLSLVFSTFASLCAHLTLLVSVS
jgi:hypothetical protein